MFDGYVPGVRKVLITIPDGLLAEIDREASVRGASRSAFAKGPSSARAGVRVC
jgi:hypothetical protein